MNAVATISQPTKLERFIGEVLPADRRDEFYRVLPKHISPERFERAVANVLMNTPEMLAADPRLIFREISKVVGLGLMLDPQLGEAYLILGWNAKTRQKEPQVRIGYATHRGNAGGARRDLQDLSAAIGHHHREGYHREIVKVALPKRGEARDRWLSRSEVARLVWTMWRAREGSRADGKAGNTTEGRHTMRHLARFVLLAYSTASRPGAVLTASWEAAAGRSYIDLDKGVFYRLREGARETNKRQPPVRLPRSILAHLRRWRRLTNSESGFVVEWRGQPVARVKVGFANAVKLAGLGEGVSPHTLRHSAVTHLMQQGVPTWEVAGFAGMGEAVLRRHYAHHHPDHMGAAVSAMGATQKRYRLA